MDIHSIFHYLKSEVVATWGAGSTFDRFIILLFLITLPFDVYRGNWLDAVVTLLMLAWVYHSVREDATNG